MLLIRPSHAAVTPAPRQMHPRFRAGLSCGSDARHRRARNRGHGGFDRVLLKAARPCAAGARAPDATVPCESNPEPRPRFERPSHARGDGRSDRASLRDEECPRAGERSSCSAEHDPAMSCTEPSLASAVRRASSHGHQPSQPAAAVPARRRSQPASRQPRLGPTVCPPPEQEHTLRTGC
jgi:hypothetical protein